MFDETSFQQNREVRISPENTKRTEFYIILVLGLPVPRDLMIESIISVLSLFFAVVMLQLSSLTAVLYLIAYVEPETLELFEY